MRTHKKYSHKSLLPLFLIILSFISIIQSAHASQLNDNNDSTNHEQTVNITEENQSNVYSDKENAHVSARTSPVYFAKRWLKLKPREKRGNNIVKVKGKLAPFNINDEWCASFVTYLWGMSGYTGYLSASPIWGTSSGFRVAVNVESLYRWAQSSGHATSRAAAGYGVVYRFSRNRWHIGLVTKARNGKGVTSIEGNVSNTIKKVKIKRKYVVGYMRP